MELQEGVHQVIPEKMLLSYGELEGPLDAEITLLKDVLQFTWSTSTVNHANAMDQAMLMAYCISEGEAVYQTTGAFRKSGEDQLQLPSHFKGKNILVYLSFVAADREKQSMSIFLGEIQIP